MKLQRPAIRRKALQQALWRRQGAQLPPRPSFRGAQLRDFPLRGQTSASTSVRSQCWGAVGMRNDLPASKPASSAHRLQTRLTAGVESIKRHPGRRAGPARDFDHRKVLPCLNFEPACFEPPCFEPTWSFRNRKYLIRNIFRLLYQMFLLLSYFCRGFLFQKH